MMRFLFVALVALVALPAAAQVSTACGAAGQQTKIFGCMDFPPAGSVITQSAPMEIHGWALSCHTAQQPSDLMIYASTGVATGSKTRVLSPQEYTVQLRGVRPDVTAYFRQYCDLTGTRDYWGYVVTINAGVLAVGGSVVALVWTDPTLDPRFAVGAHFAQVQIVVVP